MKLFNRTFGLADALVLAAFVSLMAVQMVKFAADPGVGWHLRTGEIIYSTGLIPRSDPFLSNPDPRPWVSDQWLSDLLIFSVHKAGSWPLVYALLTVVFGLTFCFLLLRANLRITRLALGSCFGALVAFKLGQIHFILRPVVFAFLFFTLVYRQVFLVYRQSLSDQNECLRTLRRSFVILPLVFLVWANMHPSFVLGLVLLLIAPVAIFLDRVVLGRTVSFLANGRGLASLVLLFGVCLAVTFVNPYFYHLHESIFSLAGSDFFMRLNEEWLRPDFSQYSGKLFERSLILLAVSLFVAGNSHLQWGFFEILLIVIFSHFGLQSVRTLPFFGIAASVPLSEALVNLGNAPFFERWKVARRLKEMLGNLELRERRSTNGSVFAILFSVLILALAAFGGFFPGGGSPGGPPAGKYPYGALDFVAKSLPAGQDAVIAARPDWGGFITWLGAGRIRAIIDDRNTLLGEHFYRDFFENMRPGGHWREFLKQFRTTHLLLEAKSPLAAAIIECGALEVLYRDETAILFGYEPAR